MKVRFKRLVRGGRGVRIADRRTGGTLLVRDHGAHVGLCAGGNATVLEPVVVDVRAGLEILRGLDGVIIRVGRGA
jgi:hypothetical protein